MSTVEALRSTAKRASTSIQLVDCDVHCTINSIEDLMPYLPDVWRRYVRESGFSAPPPSRYVRVKRNSARDDSYPPSGRIPGSDLAFTQQQHFDFWKIDRAIMNPLYHVDCLPNPDLSAALCAAHNDYVIQEWYERDNRMRGSIIIPWQDPALAAREIDRTGSHPSVVQILLPMCAGALYGQRQFHPIWEAACRHNLIVAIHFGGHEPPRASGAAPSFYLEYHVNLSQAAMAHIVSFVCEGVFEKYRELRVVIIEGGSAWLPALMWRLDRDWRGCRMEVPWVRRPPSEYIRDHIRLTTQPLEEPENPVYLLQTIEHMGSDRMLMFSTDYPHWDFDSPTRALPTVIPAALRQRIMSENAIEFYNLS